MKKLSKKAFTLGLLILLAVIAFIAGIFFYRQKDADAKKDPYGFTTISLEEFDDSIHPLKAAGSWQGRAVRNISIFSHAPENTRHRRSRTG